MFGARKARVELALDRKGGLYEKNKEKITNDKTKIFNNPKRED